MDPFHERLARIALEASGAQGFALVGGAGALLLHAEEGFDCLVVLNVYRLADKARLIAYNRHAFPDRTPSHYSTLRHYFIGCHDSSGEFLAQGMRIELTSGSYAEAAREALERTAGSITEW